MKVFRYTIVTIFILSIFLPNTAQVLAQGPDTRNCTTITTVNYMNCCQNSAFPPSNQAACTAFANNQQTTNTSYTIGTITYSGTCADRRDNDVNGLADDQDPKCRQNYGFCEVMTQACQTQVNLAASANARTRFNPNATIISTNNKTFGGVNISGIGGAIASCTNIGGLITGGIGSLKNKIGGSLGGLGQTVPVSDSTTQTQLKTINNVEQCLDGVAYSIAKNMLGQITNKTLNWVNTGFGGNPLYVKDQNSYLKSIADEQITTFLENTPESNSIFGNALRSVITSQITGKPVTVNTQQNTPQAQQYNAFMSDFTKGGWSAWLNTTQNDSNNPIGAFFQTVDSLSNNIKTAQESSRDQLNRNGGFLDLRKCVEWENNGAVTGGTNGLSGEPKCARWETVTPGSSIAEQVNFTLNSATRQLENADEINEVLGSYFDKLLNSLFNNGLGSLRSTRGLGSSGGLGGPGGNVVLGSNGQPVSGGFGYQLNASGYGSGDFDISRPQQLRAILQAQYNFVNRARDSQMVMNRLVPRLGELDYCFPGPNPTFATGADENMTLALSTWQTKFDRAIQLGNSVLGLRLTNFSTGEMKLLDKIDGAQKRVLSKTYKVDSRPGIEEFLEMMQTSYGQVAETMQQNYSQEALSNLYASLGTTAGEQAYLRGYAKSMYKRASELPSYHVAVQQMNNEYDQAISNSMDTIAQLEEVRAEVEQIVATAKARYITDRKNLGNPVDLACINDAYQINLTPITGTARLESDIPDAVVQQSAAAWAAFYNSL